MRTIQGKNNHKKQIISIEDKKVLEFLSTLSGKTKVTYETAFRKLIEFEPDINGEKMLAERDLWITKIFQFREYLIEERKFSSNFAVLCVGAVCGFFSHNRKPLVFTQAESRRLRRRSNKGKTVFMDRTDLAKLWNIADINEKWVLSNKCLGYREEDFNRITWGDIRRIDFSGEAPYVFGEFPSEKEGTTYHSFIDEDVRHVIEELLTVNKDKKDNERVFGKNIQQLNYVLKILGQRAQLTYTPTIHTLRRFLMDRLCNNMAEIKANVIIGHSTSGNVNKRYTSEDVKDGFRKTMSEISVNGNGQIKAVKAQVSNLDTTVQQLTQIIANLTKEKEELKNENFSLRTQLADTNKTVSKMLDLPTIRAEMLKAKEKMDVT